MARAAVVPVPVPVPVPAKAALPRQPERGRLRRVPVVCGCGRTLVFNTDVDSGLTTRCTCGRTSDLPPRGAAEVPVQAPPPPPEE